MQRKYEKIKNVRNVAVQLGYVTYIWFRPVSTLVDIISNNFYKSTATFRRHCSRQLEEREEAEDGEKEE
jgi:hypothetical protein